MDIDVIYNENCLEVLKRLEDNSIDAIVTDPPYNLGFMGKRWDKTGIAFNSELWKECLRIIKPGGNLLSFGGTRTYHRMVCAIEDAGFEIRDCIMWVYGSGFPKSLNIGKAVDKLQGNERKIIDRIRVDGKKPGRIITGFGSGDPRFTDIGTSEWEGYGTGLKPAYESIVLARKPISEKTIAENCLRWGVGGLNIDGCRIPTNDKLSGGMVTGSTAASEGWDRPWRHNKDAVLNKMANCKKQVEKSESLGRFPANFIHDGSQEVMELFPESKSPKPYIYKGISEPIKEIYGKGLGWENANHNNEFGDSGSAARFFYCAKASKKERNIGCEELPDSKYDMTHPQQVGTLEDRYAVTNKNNHPTVKPLALMEYLVNLVTRPGHIVLDPFIGSGTTAMACVKLGRHYIGCELDKGYYDIAIKRIAQFDK